MTAVAINPMSKLYHRLRAVDLTKTYVRRMLLPEWWDDAIAVNPAGFEEGLLYLSRHAGLDLATLRDSSRAVAFRQFGDCKFKLSKGVHPESLTLARAMATRAAQLAAEAMTEPIIPASKAGAIMRQEILGRGKPWVGFKELLEYSWSLGIPVLHISGFPKKTRKPHGLTLKIKARPIIVLCVKHDAAAWLSFILAH